MTRIRSTHFLHRPLGGLHVLIRIFWVFLFVSPTVGPAAEHLDSTPNAFPRQAYADSAGASLKDILAERIQLEPFNLFATALFALAVIHTFLVPLFLRLAHKYEDEYRLRGRSLQHEEGETSGAHTSTSGLRFKAEIFHLLGEVEAVFGIWVVPLMLAIALDKGWQTARDYIGRGLNFTEPMFVVVIMTIAASRPILAFSEQLMAVVASLGRRSPAAWWFSILSIGPLLGSFITEPAAMTISALLLSRKFYDFEPSPRLCYATLGLLFVNVSVGGTLTHFAAPPVLMVAGKWGWGLSHMLGHFGWKAVVGILASNTLYFLFFRRELMSLARQTRGAEALNDPRARVVPFWITAVHIFFLTWTVLNNHYPALFIGGFLFYIAFTRATEEYQRELALRPALLVGFFLAGLVVHGGLQGWWIAPVLSRLAEVPLFLGATVLTAFNDNAAITYLASLVPGFSSDLQYAVVSGAVVGGGLTVIANAPNPAGQSILSKYFSDGVSPLYLFIGALIPTVLVGASFLLLR